MNNQHFYLKDMLQEIEVKINWERTRQRKARNKRITIVFTIWMLIAMVLFCIGLGYTLAINAGVRF
jgi:hypothetical protein